MKFAPRRCCPMWRLQEWSKQSLAITSANRKIQRVSPLSVSLVIVFASVRNNVRAQMCASQEEEYGSNLRSVVKNERTNKIPKLRKLRRGPVREPPAQPSDPDIIYSFSKVGEGGPTHCTDFPNYMFHNKCRSNRIYSKQET
eukprot:1181398-Prorocentrum_minimum.AAC.2